MSQTCGVDITCDNTFWYLMIQHHQVGVELLSRLGKEQNDPAILLFCRNIAWTLQQNAHQMLLWLKGNTDLLQNYSTDIPAKPCVPSSLIDFYTQSQCGPVLECPPTCKEELRDPALAKDIQWSCVREFFAILIEHHRQGIQLCEAKVKQSPSPLVHSQVYQIIPFLKKNILDMNAYMKQHCAYTYRSPLLQGNKKE